MMPKGSLLRNALFPMIALLVLLVGDFVLLYALLGIGDDGHAFNYLGDSINPILQFIIFGVLVSIVGLLSTLLLRLRRFGERILKRFYSGSNYIYGLSLLFALANFILLIRIVWHEYDFGGLWAVIFFFCGIWLSALVSILMMSIPEIVKPALARFWPYMVGVVVIILAISNPTAGQFKNYADDTPSENHNKYRRVSNFILFSLFEEVSIGADGKADTVTYLGICGNFFEVRS
jgi:hypothetical protein